MREAAVDDMPAIYSLCCELAGALGDDPPRYAAVQKTLSVMISEPRARVLVAESGAGEVLGLATAWVKEDLSHGDVVVEVPVLVVAKEARLRGIGRRLMECIQEIAGGERASLIELAAARHNGAARGFYHELGFMETPHVLLEFVGDMQDPPTSEAWAGE